MCWGVERVVVPSTTTSVLGLKKRRRTAEDGEGEMWESGRAEPKRPRLTTADVLLSPEKGDGRENPCGQEEPEASHLDAVSPFSVPFKDEQWHEGPAGRLLADKARAEPLGERSDEGARRRQQEQLETLGAPAPNQSAALSHGIPLHPALGGSAAAVVGAAEEVQCIRKSGAGLESALQILRSGGSGKGEQNFDARFSHWDAADISSAPYSTLPGSTDLIPSAPWACAKTQGSRKPSCALLQPAFEAHAVVEACGSEELGLFPSPGPHVPGEDSVIAALCLETYDTLFENTREEVQDCWSSTHSPDRVISGCSSSSHATSLASPHNQTPVGACDLNGYEDVLQKFEAGAEDIIGSFGDRALATLLLEEYGDFHDQYGCTGDADDAGRYLEESSDSTCNCG